MEKSDMEKSYMYNNLTCNTYNFDNYHFKVDDKEMATKIHNNLHAIKMDDSMLCSVHKQIIPKQRMIRDIITYEFLYYEPQPTITTKHELLKLTVDELNKYQGVVGGYLIEDNKWLECTVDGRFKLKENQLGIYNTCEDESGYDKDLLWFLRKMLKHMKKFIVEGSGVKIDYKLISDEDNEICFILFVFE